MPATVTKWRIAHHVGVMPVCLINNSLLPCRFLAMTISPVSMAHNHRLKNRLLPFFINRARNF